MWRCVMMGWLVACGQPAAAPRPPSPPPGQRPVAPAARPAATAARSSAAPPECADHERAARRKDLDDLSARVEAPSADGPALLAELAALLARPCLRHIAPAISLPSDAPLPVVREAWRSTLHGVLEAALDDLTVEDGVTRLVLPHELVPAVEPDAARSLAPLRCASSDATCVRSASYIRRAETWFDARSELAAIVRYPQLPTRESFEPFVLPATTCWDDTDPPEYFDEWVSCVAAKAPRTLRYAETQLSPPVRGWLVLRGRRGHYQFSEELRAYDLATGAAYVVRDHGAIVVRPPRGAPQGREAYVGHVAVDQLRELAFILLTRDALVPVRVRPVDAVVPPQLPRMLSPDGSAGYLGGEYWSSSGQTRIDHVFADGAFRRTGSFTWPEAYDPIDTYVSELVRVVEAGLVRGCAPARLPPLAELRGGVGKVSSVDASATARADLQAELERQLDGLRSQACPRAK